MVKGSGGPGAAVMIRIGTGTNELSSASTIVDDSGDFHLEVSFDDQAVGTQLWIEASLDNANGAPETIIEVLQGSLGNRYESAHQAPLFHGSSYSNMQIYEVRSGFYLDDIAFLEMLDEYMFVYFGEQHGTHAIHELQLFVLELLTARHDDVALAMEHFQSHNQTVLDDYLEGRITAEQLRTQGEAWTDFEIHWQPLVDHMKDEARPVIATNVPRNALQDIYANGLTSPLAFFNTWDSTSPHDPYLPPRPLPPWTETFQAYFETGFDYSNHGQSWGLTYEEALEFFTDLAYIRDQTMGYWIASHAELTGDRILFVGGDWHVRTGIATPDMTVHWLPEAASASLITTTTRAGFEALRNAEFDGRHYADFILVYD